MAHPEPHEASATALRAGEDVLTQARLWLGTPYRHQASRCGVGCDCLGLLRGVWRGLYGAEPQTVPPYEVDWSVGEAPDLLAKAASKWLVEQPLDTREAGHVLLFRWRDHLPARHVAILSQVGREKTRSGSPAIIHAYERVGVVESPLVPAWERRLAHVFAFPATA